MATITQLETRVLGILGDPNKRRWANADNTSEIIDLLIEGIRTVSELVVRDAMVNLLKDYDQTYPSSLSAGEFSFAGFGRLSTGECYVQTPSDMLIPLGVVSEESDGNTGKEWEFVSRATIQARRYFEQDMTQDTTDARMWTIFNDQNLSHIEIYPRLESGRILRLIYLAEPSENGAMTLSNLLQKAVIEYAISVAATKKSFDLPLANLYAKYWRQTIGDINNKYVNVYGLSSATISYVKDVY